MIYVILGMHKSGTTLVSQILHGSGINMGEFDEGISYDQGNKFERETTLALDMEILGTSDYGVLELTPGGVPTMNDEQRGRMRGIIADCQGQFTDWGFKDPRSALTYDLWARELPEHRIIAVFRDPAEVWPRFKWRGLRKWHTNFDRAHAYLLRWHEHNRNIVRFLQETSMPSLVISYRELMGGEGELGRLQEFVGRELVDRRKPGLYRSRFRGDFFLRAAEWRIKRAGGPSSAEVLAALDARRSS